MTICTSSSEGASSAPSAAYAFYRGNAAAVHRARRAAIKGEPEPGGTALPEEFVQGWHGAGPVAERTLL
ncbi:hypothetical protein [Nocardiopsis kunsanensis]|uniref:Uncharacterized protein n=1 Tax=Nocardiopsis kunsanensis TaxID=141693 RepID=A0A918XGF8_9ACTN|nr:hypothetical protein [Nocardiopsis kunsanensis]GHD30921.1 hypothetical protein GCM10007147_33160 [Nocardiopsis kunsanensis]